MVDSKPAARWLCIWGISHPAISNPNKNIVPVVDSTYQTRGSLLNPLIYMLTARGASPKESGVTFVQSQTMLQPVLNVRVC